MTQQDPHPRHQFPTGLGPGRAPGAPAPEGWPSPTNQAPSGDGPQAGRPVGADVIRAEAAEAEETRHQDRRQGNRDRRRRILLWAGSAVVVILLIVALMVWLWSGELFLPAAN